MRITLDIKHVSRPRPHVRVRSWWTSSDDGLRDHNDAITIYNALRDDVFHAIRQTGAEFQDEGERK